MTPPKSSGNGADGRPGPAASSAGGAPAGGKPVRGAAARTVALVGWSIVLVLAALAVFYGWRAASNRDQLTDRNLRDLARLAGTVSATVEGYATGLEGVARADSAQRAGAVRDTGYTSVSALVPGLLTPPSAGCEPHAPQVVGRAVELCYRLRGGSLGAPFSLDTLEQALRSDFFDATFVADSEGHVFVSAGRSGALALQDIPPDTGKRATGRISTVREVEIAGRDYLLFLQPLRIASLVGGGSVAPVSWTVGGLVPASRFRAESLALEPPHLLFLGFLVILALLALPFLRAALMGPSESLGAMDLHRIVLGLVLAGGMLGIMAGDLHFYAREKEAVDANLSAESARLTASFQSEIRSALGEMDHWALAFDSARAQRADTSRIAIMRGFWEKQRGLSAQDRARNLSQRYVSFQMITWIDPSGRQKAKWTRLGENTVNLDVSTRAYFRRIKDGGGYSRSASDNLPWGARCSGEDCYFVESIQSRNTGEKFAEISRPYCWRKVEGAAGTAPVPSHSAVDCPANELGVQSMATHFRSLERTLLPPGVSFAVVEPDGHTLFHSDPSRNLVENFAQETGDDGELRALLAADTPDSLHAMYRGRSSRLHVTPLQGTPLSLVTVLDDRLPATAHMEALFVSVAAFLAWVLVLWGVIVALEFLGAGRMRWLWPDLWHAEKYRDVAWLLAGFAAVLLADAAMAAVAHLPVQASSFLIPPQALTVLALVLTPVPRPPCRTDAIRAWKVTRVAGWTILAFTGALQLALNIASPQPSWHRGVLGTAQLAMVVLAAWQAGRLGRTQESSRAPGPSYALATVLALTVVAVLPGYLLHREAFRDTEYRMLRTEQAQLVDAARALRERPRPGSAGEAVNAARLGLSTRLDTLPRVLGVPLPAAGAEPCTRQRSLLAEQLFSRIERFIPLVNDAAVAMRKLPDDARGWRWQTCGDGSLRLAAEAPVSPFSTELRPTWIRSGVSRTAQAPALSWVALALLVLAGYAVLYALIRWLGRRVFLLDVPEPEHVNALRRTTISRRTATLVLAPQERILAAAGSEAGLTRVAPAGDWPARIGRRVKTTVFSFHAPVAREVRDVWKEWMRAGHQPEKVLEAECVGDPKLLQVAEEVSSRPEFPRLTPDAVVDQLRETAQDYYAALWAGLGDDEKLVAARMARGAVAVPESRRATRRLIARGVLVREPELRLMNESFARFIREEVPSAEVESWASVLPSSAWQKLRFPILLALAVIVAFLFATQRSAFNSIVAIISAATVGTGTLLKLLSSVNLPGRQGE